MFFANVIIFIVKPRQIKEIFPLFLHFVTKHNNLQQNPFKTAGFHTLSYNNKTFCHWIHTLALSAGSGNRGRYYPALR